ncbi:MAG: glycosyltransferase family 2 protein [Candidatus Diapherotrites archaeon]|nr:glycosyltransferase family 2 protein [Candidatus Diapherotrites archaeon]
MSPKIKTIVFALVLVFLAWVAVEVFSIYWTTVFVTFIFLFLGSMFFFVYLDFKELKLPRLKNWPTVSVIIPCYNSEKTIKDCVESVKRMRYPLKLEIIVVNDASTDGSLKILMQLRGIKLVNLEKNSGKAAAINSVLKSAKGELVCCIDSDTFPREDALLKTVPFFADEKVGAVTCLIRVHEPKTFFKKIQDLEYLLGFGYYQTMLSHIGAAFLTPGPMCVYRKKYVIGVGMYDEKNITEDMEIALRLQKHGYGIKSNYQAVVETVVPSTLRHWVRQRIRWYRGKIFNTAKYRELLFNKKYGFLGNFSLPFTFLLEMSAVFILFLISVIIFQAVFFGLEVLFLSLEIGGGLPVELPQFIVNSSAVFFFITTLSTFGFGLFVAFDLSKEKFGLKYVLPTIFIVFFYGLMVAIMWMFSLFKEINRSDYSW